MKKINKKQASFTLIELLMIIAILGLLVTLLIPSLDKAREKSRSAVCMTQLSQLGITIFNRNDKRLIHHFSPVWYNGAPGKAPWSRKGIFPGDTSILKCPSDPKSNPDQWNPSYGYNYKNLNSQLMIKVTNPAETIFFAENDRYDAFHPWITRKGAGFHVSNLAAHPAPIGIRHLGAGNILWVDGHVSGISGRMNVDIHLNNKYWDLE